jgi:hypothetical protein
MSAGRTAEPVSHSLRPVVIAVVAAKVLVMSFLLSSMAGFVPMPATAEHASVEMRLVD